MINDDVDDEIEDSVFGSFCLVSFAGVGSNYVGIYARCIRIFLCTITAPLKTNVPLFKNIFVDTVFLIEIL